MVQHFKTYGPPPYHVAVIHGGPGAIGEMAPVARHLSKTMGVLEPFQWCTSVPDQILELKTILEEHGNLPITLVGFSWGAFLSLTIAAQYPEYVKKLILIGCPPFSDEDAKSISQVRKNRLKPTEQNLLSKLIDELDKDPCHDKEVLYNQLVNLMDKADYYLKDFTEDSILEFQHDIFEKVWPQAANLRKQGYFLDLANNIRCPVTFIHGDYDPHPIQGIQNIIEPSQFFILEKCGHTPWNEKEAKVEFFQFLLDQLTT